MKTILTLVVLAATVCRTCADEGQSPRHAVEAEDRKYAAVADYYQQEGWSFDQIFAALCKLVLTSADNDPKLALEDHVRSMFGGLWIWSLSGGNCLLQRQIDKGMHFIGGGMFEGYWDIGRSAAVIKERVDTRDPQNRFDLDDMAATMLGARWMNLATDKDRAAARRWISLWASGQYTINRTLPKLQNGQIPQGKEATAQAVESIRQAMDKALTLPPPAATPPISAPPPAQE